MDPDHLKQPSKHPSSNQRKHHHHHRSSSQTTTTTSSASVTAATEDDNFVAALKRKEKTSSSSGSSSGANSRGSKAGKQTNLLFESKEEKNADNNADSRTINTSSKPALLDGGISARSKHREVGKVKPIRIAPPPSSQQETASTGLLDDEDKIKFRNSLIKSKATAWDDEEPCSDNQKRHHHHHHRDQFEDEDDDDDDNREDLKGLETPEKMFINTSELGPTKYYNSKSNNKAMSVSAETIIYEDEDDLSPCENLTSDNNNKRSSSSNNQNNNNPDAERATEDRDEERGNAGRSSSKVFKHIEEEDAAEEVHKKTATRVSSAVSSTVMSRSSSSACSERVKVIVRCRPISQREVEQGYECVVKVNIETGEIEVRRPQSATSTHSLYSNSGNVPELKVFAFDSVFDERIPQKQLYDDAFRPLVDSVLEGYNGTIFAYGQTGTGKTHTMEGLRDQEDQHGVIPNAFKHIFSHVVENPNRQYLIRASYLEIYQEEIRDLLSKDRKQHRELKESPTSGVYVKDLSTYLCSNFSEINDLMTRGNKNRAVGATNMNEHSSRSHAIFQITIEVSEEWPDGQNHFKVGKLNLVDLAGSERQGKTGAVGERLKEATKINLSLSALGNVIAALVDGKSTHIPYRDSKLTRLLQDSFGGNSHTIMVATVGPASFNWEETITTLRYASRAKKIKNKPKVNEDPKDAMLRQYQEEIERLRAELEKKKAKQAEMLQRSQQESSSGRAHTGRARSSRAHTASSTASDSSSSASDQLRQIEEQRLKELASLLAPYGVDPSADPQDIMNQLDDRRTELLNDSKTLKEEKDRLLKRLDETQSLVKNTAEECKKLSEKIRWLESKVLTGGKSLVDHTNEQQKLIQAKQQELAEQTQRYEEMRRKLQENEMTTTELRSNAEALEAELHTKTKKLKKLSQKLYFSKEELVSANEEHVNTMKELENVLLELKKEFSLKRMIIDNFIPYQSRKMIESRVVWDKQMEEYKLASLNSNFVLQRPPINRMTKTPLYSLSETGTVHMVDNVHYLDENILQLHPELPKRRTKDYVPPSRDPYITSLIKRAVEDAEKEVTVDCRNLSRKRTKTAKIPQKNSDYFKMGDNLVCRRVKSAKPVTRSSGSSLQQVQFRDFVVVSNFHKHFNPGNYGHASVLRGSGPDY